MLFCALTLTPGPVPVGAHLLVSNQAEISADAAARPAGITEVPLEGRGGLDTVSFATPNIGCVGGRGQILCTNDGGRSWQRRFSGRLTILQVQFLNARLGWAVAPNLLLATTDGGTHWRVRAHVSALEAVDFVTSRQGWAVTKQGILLRTQDSGQRFVRQALPVPVKAVSFLSTKVGWALGRDGEILQTTDGGLHWRHESVLRVGATWQEGHGQLQFTNRRVGWVLLAKGEACLSQMPYVLYQTRDGGQHWRLVLVGPSACGGAGYPTRPYGPAGYPGGVAAVGEREAFLAVASPAAATLHVVATYDAGQRWVQWAPVSRNMTGSTVAIDFIDARHGWVVTGGEIEGGIIGRILHSSDGGHHWIVQIMLRR
jgi:photosystem II stability/assembly factor-like uncharacterized protein